ncbi:MAG: 3-deoxy-7-phosphoheptulonate synthase [Planctomycetota bacterium]
MSLDDLRKQLDAVDRSILEQLARRKALVEGVVSAKASATDFIRDLSREERLLGDRVQNAKSLGLDATFVTRVFREILDHSVRFQEDLLSRGAAGEEGRAVARVGYQGTAGAYSTIAARNHFSARREDIELIGFTTFREMLETLEEGGLEYAVQPVENTTAGSINEAYDLLRRLPLFVVGEEVLKIDHCLCALEEVPLSRIRRVLSHPVALAQCTQFLATLENCHVESFADTAMAVRHVSEGQDLSEAAIASEEAAHLYGLKILKRGIADQKENYTRFWIVKKEPIDYDRRVPCKTSLVLATKHQEGALAKCLNLLVEHHLNLTKLESRPRPNTPWEYLFYLDFEGNAALPDVQHALEELSKEVSTLRVLGSYPARTTEAARPASPKPSSKTTPKSAEKIRGERRPSITLEVAEKLGYKLASRAHHAGDTIVRVGSVLFGGEHFVVVAGPPAIESAEQIRACADEVLARGAHLLSGGALQPSRGGFAGLGFEGVELLVSAGEAVGLPVVTEVCEPADVDIVAEKADLLRVGPRQMQNTALLERLGRSHRPVLLERGVMASIDELLAAAEHVLQAGNRQVIVCESGIRTFETATPGTLDLTAVPVLRERTHLPVVVDPVHACGSWRYVGPMAAAAQAAGANGVLLSIHPDPAQAKSGGEESLGFERFAEVMRSLG